MKRTKREQDRVKELAREYKSKGYQVWIEPRQTELPVFLRGLKYVPDLLVKSDTENIIVEVKSSASIKSARYLEKITRLVQDQKGWVFELVMTNPKEPKEAGRSQSVSPQDYQSITSALERAKALIQDKKKNYHDAAFLLAWSGFEGAARYALSQANTELKLNSPRDLIRNTVMIGLISRDEFYFLQEILKLRNALVHGDFSVSIAKKDVLHLIETSQNLLRASWDEDAT